MDAPARRGATRWPGELAFSRYLSPGMRAMSCTSAHWARIPYAKKLSKEVRTTMIKRSETHQVLREEIYCKRELLREGITPRGNYSERELLHTGFTLTGNYSRKEWTGTVFILHCNFLRYHFEPFSLNLVLPSVVKPSGAIAKRGTRHLT